MYPTTRAIALLIFVLRGSDAKVEFTYSTMYDIYDFEDSVEITLPHCDKGCLIYASTMSETPGYGTDPFIKNLLVNDFSTGEKIWIESVANVANQFDPITWQKVPLDIMKAGKYSILNLNEPGAKGSDVTVWVIQRSKALEFDYEIYDAAAMKRAPAVPKTTVTIMSAARFTLYAEKGEANSYVAWLTGFENALEANPDKCNYAYQTAVGSAFDGFQFPVDAPIISLVFAKKTVVDLKADYTYLNVRSLSKSGFITSPGYNGCDRLPRDQVYRAKFFHYSDQIELHGEPDFYEVEFDAIGYLDADHKLEVEDLTSRQTTQVYGTPLRAPFSFPKTQIVTVYYHEDAAPQSFLLRFTSELKERGTPPTTVTSSTSGTSTTLTPTTSAVRGASALIAGSVLLMVMAARR